MSSQSMKYHSLPSYEMIVAFKAGDLSAADSKWVTQLIRSNDMVKAVADEASASEVAAVESISSRVSQQLTTAYFSRGFWSKYGVWIGLSAITLLIGLFYLFNGEQTEPLYTVDKMQLEKSTSSNNSPLEIAKTSEKSNSAQQKNNLGGVTSVENEQEENTKPGLFQPDKREKSTTNTENNSKQDEMKGSNTKPVPVDAVDIVDSKPTKGKDPTPKITPPKEASSTTDNTREFSTKDAKSNQNVMLAVQNVQIMAKINPDDIQSSGSNVSGGNPLGARSEARSNGSYSVNDMPHYPGGDRALQNYFIGELRPIKIPKKQDVYAKSVVIDLALNSRGKLKEYTIHGKLHPKHQKALVKAIENLPRFEKGKEKVNYTLGISF